MIPKALDFERPSSSVNIILIKISENTTSDDVDAEQDDMMMTMMMVMMTMMTMLRTSVAPRGAAERLCSITTD